MYNQQYMSIREVRTLALQYTMMAGMLVVSWFVSTHFTDAIDASLIGASDTGEMLLVLFSIVIAFALGFIIYELAKPTIIPSFVLAIFFGIVSRDILSYVVQNPTALATIITIGAIFILFEGGLETPFTKFKTLLGPILSLAIVGTLINALLLSAVLQTVSQHFGLTLSLAALVLLGAALASTDPAAIIPSFQGLHFRNPRVKHIAISESAINDVVGAVMVTIFLGLFTKELQITTIIDAYHRLLQWEHLMHISHVVIVGCGVGIIGFLVLQLWSNWRFKVVTEEGSDAALFLAVPLFAYTIASALGGSGFLAVFLSSLMFHLKAHCRHVEHYFNHTIEGFMKPIIFMLLGAMVDPRELLAVAGIGIISGVLFMFVLRPLIVFTTLLPFCITGQKLKKKELLFLSFVRETGVIPAALLITIQLAGIPGANTATAIGLWIMLLTLTIEPPLTPLIARKLKLATEAPTLPERQHHGPVAVLCSRGYSFPERMRTVVDWCQQHAVHNIVLLHCPEERFTLQFVEDVHQRAQVLFDEHNERLTSTGQKDINFEFICGPGLLQDNIEKMIESGDVSIIFVGSKMLDYRLEDVKNLQVPFYFMS